MKPPEYMSPDEHVKVKTVFTAGVFDLFHAGHLNVLKRCKDMCDTLIVGVLTDEAVTAYKPMPVIHFEHRVRIVQACRFVDMAIPQEDTNATYLLEFLQPDLLVHGGAPGDDWEIGQTFMGKEKCLWLPYTHGISSTDIKGRVR